MQATKITDNKTLDPVEKLRNKRTSAKRRRPPAGENWYLKLRKQRLEQEQSGGEKNTW